MDEGARNDGAARIDELLGNAAWVRRLAQRLLADRELAEDVEQETWIAALRSGPSGPELRPWLARVVRNFALQRRRTEGAREQRERRVARPDRLPSSSETVERAELHARLVQAVLALDEPYRTTILWRYFEELDADEIARRAGIDVATVRSRVARAREKLRDELTRRGGEEPERWLAALLPLGASPTLAPTDGGAWIGGTGAVAMGMKLVGTAAAVALLAAALWWAWPSERGEAGGPAAPAAPIDAQLAELAAPADRLVALDERGRSLVENSTTPATAASTSARLHGVVLDEDGRVPLAAVRVCYRTGSEIDSKQFATGDRTKLAAETDATGRFELEAPSADDVGLWFERDGWFPLKLSPADLTRDLGRPIEVVLAPLGRIELALTDENGAPVADARVVYMIDVGRGSQDHRWAYRHSITAGSTGPDGRLTIAGLPCGMPIDLRGARTTDDDWLGVATIDVHQRVLPYEAKLLSKPKVRGRVVRAGGRPAAGGNVTWQPFPLGYRDPVQTRAGDDGRFVLENLRPGKAEVRFGPPGTKARVVTLAAGETLDVGDLEVPDVFELGGRLVSSLGALDGSFVVRAFRGGRQLVEMRATDGSFHGAATAGELELLVTRGGNWDEDYVDAREILARMTLLEPATNVEISLDAGRGAIEFTLEEPPPRADADAGWMLFEGGPDGALDFVSSGSALRQASGRVRIGPVIPGRYRVLLSVDGLGPMLSQEVDVVASKIADGGTLSARRASFVARVVDLAGKPVAHAAVTLRGQDSDVQASTGDDGRARFDDLEPGSYHVKVGHGDLGRLVRENIAVLPGEANEQVFELGGFAVIEGTLTSGSVPVPSTSVELQPSGSNDTYNASTDVQGRFRLDGLPAGRLRVWVSGRCMTSVDVAAGETRRLDLSLGTPRTLRFVRDGAALDGLFSVAAIGRDPVALAARCWTMGDEKDTTVVMEVPEGPALYCISCASTGSQFSFVAVAPGPRDSVEMPRGFVALATTGAWHGPLPRAKLISLDGHEVIGMWGREIALALELDSDGRAGADGRADVRWP